jgi:hypothetical protein
MLGGPCSVARHRAGVETMQDGVGVRRDVLEGPEIEAQTHRVAVALAEQWLDVLLEADWLVSGWRSSAHSWSSGHRVFGTIRSACCGAGGSGSVRGGAGAVVIWLLVRLRLMVVSLVAAAISSAVAALVSLVANGPVTTIIVVAMSSR